jgi:hypothetical protein
VRHIQKPCPFGRGFLLAVRMRWELPQVRQTCYRKFGPSRHKRRSAKGQNAPQGWFESILITIAGITSHKAQLSGEAQRVKKPLRGFESIHPKLNLISNQSKY